MISFEAWFEGLGIRHFTAAEFTGYFAAVRDGVCNSPPPRELWEHIVPTLRVVDALREELGKPCRILSSYRSPEYNQAVGGVPLSQHVDFTALDIAFPGVAPEDVHGRLLAWRDEGRFTGGLGLYPQAGFVHIDTRPHNASWQGA